MSFIANPSTQNDASQAGIISNDGFFPDVDLPVMRDKTRIDGTVTDDRLIDATVSAIIHVNDQLNDYKQASMLLGYQRLQDIPAAQINRSSVLIAHYLRAVYCTAKADLIERYTDYDTTATSLDDKKLVGWLSNGPDDQRRNAAWAISDIIGRPHTTVELI
ncbi:head completion/stabilization protein [Undibacterium jejuense]|uniref:Head completion/stabilization protein n=1 Tax=Undibacterium jejuense TaxID=1344949 RepID=A0A923HEF7_9BURK|nr:head completion/stabilization protein [Undibacterium jejuense]MBC3860495.1 head completion/stabilization protein [Undibacterium jejuense]